MFGLIEAKKYRCLKDVSQRLNPFEILVGANASGKSAFFDIVGFLSDFVAEGLDFAIEKRTPNFHDLVWGRDGEIFSLTVAAAIPQRRNPSAVPSTIHYEVSIRLDIEREELHVASEKVSFPEHSQSVINRIDGNVSFWAETSRGEMGIRVGYYRNHSVLRAIPSDLEFPGSAWLRDLLQHNVSTVALKPEDLARPNPLGGGAGRKMTGATLSRQIATLKSGRTNQFQDWLTHVKTALPEVRTVETSLREEDKSRYVLVEYENGVRVPAWALSEGTLRLLALTILAYVPRPDVVYLIEEPENGVHPTALEAIYQSLSSIYDAQVLVATHSPSLLSMVTPRQMLCFSRSPEGTSIVRGNEHPALQAWQGEVSMGDIVASGILG